jgi:hypothetical protein
MAGGSKVTKCGTCNKNVTKNSKALLCDGICNFCFHSDCIGLNQEEYNCFLILGNKAIWMCNKCRLHNLSSRENRSVQIQTTNELNEEDSSVKDQIKMLTDQLYSLSKNQKEISEQQALMMKVNEGLQSAVNNQADAISELLTYDKDIKTSFASKLKCGLAKLSPGQEKSCLANNIRQIEDIRTIGDVKQSDDTDDGYTRVLNKRNKKELKSSQGIRKQDPKKSIFITGDSEDDDKLKLAVRKSYLFVSRLDPTTTTDELMNFLKGRVNEVCTVEKLSSRHPSDYSSFKIGVTQTVFKEAFTSTFWPKGVFVSKFLFSKKSLNGKGSINLQTG